MDYTNAYTILRLLAAITFIVALLSLRLKFRPYTTNKNIDELDTINRNKVIYQILIHILFLFAVLFIITMTLLYPAPPASLSIIDPVENNFVPLVVISELMRTEPFIIMVYNIIGNIVLFIPFGFLLPLKYKKMKQFTQCIMVGLSFSVGIELCQLLLPLRQTDIDDVLLNTLGTITGYCLYTFILTINKNIVSH